MTTPPAGAAQSETPRTTALCKGHRLPSRRALMDHAEKLEGELIMLEIACQESQDSYRIVSESTDDLERRLHASEAECKELRASAGAIRELMNCYNLGGWTDAESAMKRALAAESEVADMKHDMERLYDSLNKEASARIEAESANAAVREACARVCDELAAEHDELGGDAMSNGCQQCSDAIRALPSPPEQSDEAHVKKLEESNEAQIDEALGLHLISIRLQKSLIEDLKMIATLNGIGYQPLMRQILKRFADGEKKRILKEKFDEAKKAREAMQPDNGSRPPFLRKQA